MRQKDRQTYIETKSEKGASELEAYRQTSSLVRAVISLFMWYVLLHSLIEALVAG